LDLFPPSGQERDPNGLDPKGTLGAKLDAGKPPVARGLLLHFPRAVMAVAAISEYGAKKYSWLNWQKVPDKEWRYRDALARHVVLDAVEDYDRDSKMLHAAHAAWNALAVLEFLLEEGKALRSE
jgi:hypothetical protein